MVYLKPHRKYKAKILNNNSTDSLELPEQGIVSAIQLEFQATNATGLIALIKQRIIDHLTAIEVTDGGTKKMFSLTGQELKALDFYHLGKIPPESAILYDGNIQRTTVVLPFGEFIGDTKHGLDLSAWDQVNLDITNDFTTSYVAANNFKVDATLLTLEDLAAKPPGYYKSYEWKNEAPSAQNQYVYHKIPTTDKIRRLMCQFDPTVSTATAIPEDVTSGSNNLKLFFKERVETVIDLPPKYLFWLNAMKYGKPETFARYPQSTTVYSDSGLGRITNMPFGDLAQSTGLTAPTAQPRAQENNLRFFVLDNVVVGPASNNVIDAHCIGEGYYDTAVLFDADSPDEAMFLDPSKGGSGKGPIEVEWYAASGSAHKLRTFLTVPQKQGQA